MYRIPYINIKQTKQICFEFLDVAIFISPQVSLVVISKVQVITPLTLSVSSTNIFTLTHQIGSLLLI